MKKGNITTASLVHYNTTLFELMARFPEIKSPIEKHIDKLVKTKKCHRIIAGLNYSSRDSFPKSMSVGIECYDGKDPKGTTYTLHFKSQWILE